jgi:hypothetical protein
VLSASSVSISTRVVLSECLNTNLSSHVELVSNGGSSDVKPVDIIWSKILVASGLIVGGPLINK